MYKIRSSVKALIIHNHHLLTIEKQSSDSKKYIMPGGGQDFNETLSDAVARECMEELGVKVEAGKLLWVREFISKNHISDQPMDDQGHIVEHIFEAFLEEIPERFDPMEPDSTQTGVVWLPIDQLSEINYYPKELIPMIQGINSGESTLKVYVGDIN
ncbi:NUDIX domain-containing protein [Fictibacillus sp. BK138]|uniref:NUDIX domain-containing protein n=1 Tax=Fictibacillus sp. BK138 TaxID=2512121 RepID=UPI0010D87DE7|nr:NUDIX domain-containing protein [Fictibacillus sp. BK138]RZT16409.1 ADP-ribose pyrophosphatase YjhB (NUDIX family) [Fictibacillus sp. BK138]